MSYYYKYDFISPEPTYSLIKEELKSYFDSGAIDDVLFESWTDKCLRKLGKSSYYITSTVLHLDNFEARLPDNFYKVREAWLCTQVNGLTYREAASFYSQASSLQTIKISPVTTSEPCVGDCLPDMIQAVYKTNNEYNQNFKKQYLLRPGNINAQEHCSSECANFGSSSPETFDIHGNKFLTNFRNGTVFLIFYAKETNEAGYQMVPDNYRILEYIEKFIKFKCFELLSNQVIDETYNQIQQKLQKYERDADEAYIMAESEIKKQTTEQKVQAIKRQLRSFDKYRLPERPKTIWRR
jgi:hypothetical protein